MKITTSIGPNWADDISVGDALRVTRRTVAPSEEGFYDVELEFEPIVEPIVYRVLDVPVIDGFATLPDGRKIASSARVVRVPYLDAENAERLKAAIPPDADPDWDWLDDLD